MNHDQYAINRARLAMIDAFKALEEAEWNRRVAEQARDKSVAEFEQAIREDERAKQ